jgi:hypothetical protein
VSDIALPSPDELTSSVKDQIADYEAEAWSDGVSDRGRGQRRKFSAACIGVGLSFVVTTVMARMPKIRTKRIARSYFRMKRLYSSSMAAYLTAFLYSGFTTSRRGQTEGVARREGFLSRMVNGHGRRGEAIYLFRRCSGLGVG